MTKKPLYVLFTIDEWGNPSVLLEESMNRVRLEKRGEYLLKNFKILTDVLPIQKTRAQLIVCKDRAMLGCAELPECIQNYPTVKHHIKRVCELLDSMFEGWVEECDGSLMKELSILLGYADHHYRAHDLILEAYLIVSDIYDRNRGITE